MSDVITTCIVCRKDMGSHFDMNGVLFSGKPRPPSRFDGNLTEEQDLLVVVCDDCLAVAANVTVREICVEETRRIHGWTADYVHSSSMEGWLASERREKEAT